MKAPSPAWTPTWSSLARCACQFIIYAPRQLEDQLPGNLIARVEERIVFEAEGPNGTTVILT